MSRPSPMPHQVTAATRKNLASLTEGIWESPHFALVGAGYSFPAALPKWENLPGRILDAAKANGVDTTGLDDLRVSNSEDAVLHLGVLRDRLSGDFTRLFRDVMSPEKPEAVRLRRNALLGIPFRTIVTTNYDTLGPPPCPTPTKCGCPPRPRTLSCCARPR